MLDPASAGPVRPARVYPEPDDSDLGATVTRPAAHAALLSADGEIDALTAGRLEAVLTQVLDERDAVLVVDLRGVTFLASCGLAVLIRAAQRAADRGVDLRLVTDSRAVIRPLEVTGSDQLFDIHADVGSALDAASDIGD